MNDPRLSVVIPVYNNWWLTARCLRELHGLRASRTVPFETIVIDNGSTDETPEAIARMPWVRYIRHDTNRNFAGACNAGVQAANAPLVLLLNNDAYPIGDALSPIVAAFDRPEVAIAGGALFFEDGVTQSAGLVVLPNAHWHYSCRNLPADLDGVTRPRDAIGVSGAAMAVRAQWFIDSGGFDETFVNGFEDVDLCLRAREQERAIAYVPAARFAHYEAASEGRFARERDNERRFYHRWASRLAGLARTHNGEVGAVVVRWGGSGDPLLAAARDDLIAALRAFGHPVVAGGVAARRWYDRRFRHAASLGWFTCEIEPPGIIVSRRGLASSVVDTHGAIELSVAWLACASPQRIAACRVRISEDPARPVIGTCGEAGALSAEGLGYPTVRITPEMLLGGGPIVEVSCVVHCGLTDDAAFGNVLLAQAGIPAIALERDELRAIFAPDVAIIAERRNLSDAVGQLSGDPDGRRRYGRALAADARRRFSPRRSAIRIVDLLRASRFGLERPAPPVRHSPITIR